MKENKTVNMIPVMVKLKGEKLGHTKTEINTFAPAACGFLPFIASSVSRFDTCDHCEEMRKDKRAMLLHCPDMTTYVPFNNIESIIVKNEDAKRFASFINNINRVNCDVDIAEVIDVDIVGGYMNE